MKCMNYKPLISVIMPVYQCKRYLRQAINSVLKQTYSNYELILVDDGSNDGSSQICDEYVKQYEKVYCIHKANKGVSHSRNSGMQMAQGELIIFVDSDDYIAANLFEEAVRVFSDYSTDMYLFGFEKFGYSEGKMIPKMPKGNYCMKQFRNHLLELYSNNVLHAIGNKIYRMDIIRTNRLSFVENWNYYEDIFFSLSYIQKCQSIFVGDQVLYSYRINKTGSLSKKFSLNNIEAINATYIKLSKMIKLNISNRKIFYQYYFRNIEYSILQVFNSNYNYIVIRKVFIRICKSRIFRRAMEEKELWDSKRVDRKLYELIYSRNFLMAFLYKKIKYYFGS